MDLVGAVVQAHERLLVKQRHQEVEGRVIVRYYGEQRGLFLAQRPQVHFVLAGDALYLRDIEGRKPDGQRYQNRGSRLAFRLAVYLVLLDSDMFRAFFPLQRLEQHIQRRHIFLVVFPRFGK
ncbi:hypothetical protein SDC9_143076 [bioreactor metagenome]|uniref:Uncharacterized protein n=1 Tax=bioreactor metagenome TaxID=1076179 RepID=A0A645E2C3_9ZZZZ